MSGPTPPLSSDLLLDDLKAVVRPANIDDKWKLIDKRYEYAWAYFDFHAKQRIQMFNFFVLFLGFYVGANMGLLERGKFVLSTCMAGLGVVLTVIFHFLDRRNEEFVHIAEDVLEHLEYDVLFSDYDRDILWPRRRSWMLGIMQTEKGRPGGLWGFFGGKGRTTMIPNAANQDMRMALGCLGFSE